MTANLTEDQRHALTEHPEGPICLVDPVSNRLYVLLSAEKYEQVRALLDKEFHPSEAYGAIDRAFAEGWNAPGMDDYDRYEEIKR